MGEVLTTMKVMPDSPDVDLEAIKATIKDSMPEGAKLNDMKEACRSFDKNDSSKNIYALINELIQIGYIYKESEGLLIERK